MRRTKIVSVFVASVLSAALLLGCEGQSGAVKDASGNITGIDAGEASQETETTLDEASSKESESENDADILENNKSDDNKAAAGDIKIVFTNDIHGYVENTVTDEEGNVTGDGLRLSKVAALVKDMEEDGENVLLVDAGDEIQGNVYAAMDKGSTIIDLMNAAGYDLATPGNHDFDYGIDELYDIAHKAGFTYVSCNFYSKKSDTTIFDPSKVFEVGDKKIAFIGVTTPESLTSSTPAFFQDENGEFIYSISGSEKAEDLYKDVQKEIDKLKEDVDYVIALGHTGIEISEKNKGISCEDIIKNVSGLSAYISGHSHTAIDDEIVNDIDGNPVVLTQAACNLSKVGILTISADGGISSELIDDYDKEDEKVAALEKQWFDDVDYMMNEKIATTDCDLYICNPNDDNQRLIRAMELNSGDLVADSIYWFLNDKIDMDCDIAIQNGGGVRDQVKKGDITYFTAKNVEPFGNMICLISATGQQIVDALEMGVTDIGEWDDKWNCPMENGAFMQVAGVSYTVDAAIPSSVKVTSEGMFEKVDGKYRVKDVKVYNRETGEYEPIELDKTYNVGGINYLLRNSGNGLCMFKDSPVVTDFVGEDYIILSEYIKSFEVEDDYPCVKTKNSPLSNLDGYLLDYEEPYGSGRIKIENIKYKNLTK